MKKKLRPVILGLMLTVLSACGQVDNTVENITTLTTESVTNIADEGETETNTPEELTETIDESVSTQSEVSTSETIEESEVEIDPYVGEYNDYIIDEPNLQIQRNVDGTYMIQIGIFRTISLENCVGVLTDKGIEFKALDAWEDMKGIITLEGDIASVTFTNLSWSYYSSVNTFEYYKTSDVPNIHKMSTYQGEYNDYVTNEPNLQIRNNGDDTYTVQIDIPDLVYLDDGKGEMTGLGLEFTATAPNGQELTGLLELREEEITLSFTNSVWSEYSDITEYKYYKVSDTPNISGGY